MAGAVSPGSGGCKSCEGRGWRFISPRRTVQVSEGAMHLVRLLCPDCPPEPRQQLLLDKPVAH